MPWRTLTLEDGTQVRVHTRESGRRQQLCYICGATAPFLCDYPMNGGTCDRAMCDRHRFKPRPAFGRPDTADIDYCQEHRGGSDEG